MGKNLYVGNLSYDTTEQGLQAAFAEHGEVLSAKVITDRYTGRPRGFGFVEMVTDEGAREAISALDGKDLDGRQIKVAEAKPRPERRSGGYDRGPRW